MRRSPMNLPNSLTLVRMFLVPLLVVVLLTEFEGRQILGVSEGTGRRRPSSRSRR